MSDIGRIVYLYVISTCHSEGRYAVEDPAAERGPADRISVVIPACNEARNLPHVLEALPVGLHEVIVADGHSDDDTIEVSLRVRPDVKIIQQARRGKGNALACGFAELTDDVVVMLDAGGSADPREISAFVAALAAGAEFAKGTRFDHGGCSHEVPRFRRVGNTALNRLVNLLFGTYYTDLCYGYNALRAHLTQCSISRRYKCPTTCPTACYGATGLRLKP